MGPKGSMFEGKTLDDAVRKGLDTLGMSRAEVMINVVEEGSGGFLGFGARPYKVIITPRPGGPPRDDDDHDRERRGGRGRREGGRDGRRGRGDGARGERNGRGRRGEGRGGEARSGEARGEGRGGERRGEGRERRGDRERRGGRRQGERTPEPREAGEAREPREVREVRAPAPAPATATGGDDAGGDRRRRRRGRRGGRGRRGERRGPEPVDAAVESPSMEPMESMQPMEQPEPEVRMRAEPSVPVTPVERAEPVDEPAPVVAEAREEALAPAAAARSYDEPQREPAAAEAMDSAALAESGRRWTEDLMKAMGFDARVTARAEGDRVDVAVEVTDGDDLLTGPKGEVRQAMQHLLNRMVNRGEGSRYHLQLEINDFWAQREEELRRLARELADEALEKNDEVVTEYLNAQERRIVHVTLREDARVKTYSLGTGMIKRLAIAPAGFDEGDHADD